MSRCGLLLDTRTDSRRKALGVVLFSTVTNSSCFPPSPSGHGESREQRHLVLCLLVAISHSLEKCFDVNHHHLLGLER